VERFSHDKNFFQNRRHLKKTMNTESQKTSKFWFTQASRNVD